MEKINFKRLSSVLKKNIYISIIIIILFSFCGLIYSYNMVTPKYKSVSTILLGSNSSETDTISVTQSEITLNKNLISTYGKILTSNKVLSKVIDNLNLNITYSELYNNIEIKEVNGTQILQVGVINQSANSAQKIANELNDVFIEEIKEIYKLDNIKVVDEATFPSTPYNVNHAKDILIFFAIGVIASAIIISIRFFFDTTIKIEQDIEEYVGLNVIGTVPKHIAKENEEELIVQSNSKSSISEALKTIRTNISFTKTNSDARTILFTSCNAGEGKSWITSNMAVAYAQSNQNVIIIDADMRKGRQDKIFDVANNNGLSNCLTEIKNNKDFKKLEKYIQETDVPKVHLMTMGIIPPNPSELLLSSKMEDLICMLKCIYDVIIIDGTPCNLVSDSIPLSRIVDTTVVIVESRKTKIEDLVNIKKAISNIEGNITGVILNKKESKNKEYKKGYYYGHVEETAQIEVESHTVKELILNRRKYEEKVEQVKEIDIDKLDILNQKIDDLENKLLNIPNANLENYKNTIEEIKKIYGKEIDKNRLAGEIKENIIKNELLKKLEENNNQAKNMIEQKIDALNYVDKIEELANKICNLDDSINENVESKINSINEEILNKINDLNYNIDEKMSNKINSLNESMTNLNTNMENKINNLNVSMSEEITNKINNIDNSLNEEILNRIDDLSDSMSLKNITNKINDLSDNVTKEVTDKIDNIKNGLNEEILENISALGDNLNTNMESQIKDLNSSINEELKTRIHEPDNSINEEILDKVSSLENNISETMLNNISNLNDSINESMSNKINNLNEDIVAKVKEPDNSINEEILNKINNLNEKVKLDKQDVIMDIICKMQDEQTKRMMDTMQLNDIVYEIQELNKKYERFNDIERAILDIKTEEKVREIIEETNKENISKIEQMDNKEQINQIIEELKNINDKYEILVEKINNKDNYAEENNSKGNVVSKKNNIIELEQIKDKIQKKKLSINYGEEISYEQLLDYAVEIYDLNQDDLNRRVE